MALQNELNRFCQNHNIPIGAGLWDTIRNVLCAYAVLKAENIALKQQWESGRVFRMTDGTTWEVVWPEQEGSGNE